MKYIKMHHIGVVLSVVGALTIIASTITFLLNGYNESLLWTLVGASAAATVGLSCLAMKSCSSTSSEISAGLGLPSNVAPEPTVPASTPRAQIMQANQTPAIVEPFRAKATP